MTAGVLKFTLTVTGQGHNSGTGTGTGTVTVTVTDPRTLATLSNLTLSSGVLYPEFDINTTVYTALVLNSVSTLTVTPTTTGSDATVAFLNNTNMPIIDMDVSTAPLDMTLNFGDDNVIKVKVTAEIGSAVKTYTVTVTRAVQDVTVPDAPTSLTATPGGDKPTQINLMWTTPDNNGNRITDYRIEVSNNGNNGSWTDLEANTGNTDTTYEHTDLAPGDTRYYRVSARNALGLSDPSGTNSATTLSGGICARTAQVRNAIVEEIMDVNSSVATCADVTSAHLMSLSSTLDLTSKGINSLKTGDFVGLTNLTSLRLEEKRPDRAAGGYLRRAHRADVAGFE